MDDHIITGLTSGECNILSPEILSSERMGWLRCLIEMLPEEEEGKIWLRHRGAKRRKKTLEDKIDNILSIVSVTASLSRQVAELQGRSIETLTRNSSSLKKVDEKLDEVVVSMNRLRLSRPIIKTTEIVNMPLKRSEKIDLMDCVPLFKEEKIPKKAKICASSTKREDVEESWDTDDGGDAENKTRLVDDAYDSELEEGEIESRAKLDYWRGDPSAKTSNNVESARTEKVKDILDLCKCLGLTISTNFAKSNDSDELNKSKDNSDRDKLNESVNDTQKDSTSVKNNKECTGCCSMEKDSTLKDKNDVSAADSLVRLNNFSLSKSQIDSGVINDYVSRRYKLERKTKFEIFEQHLLSELEVKNLDYVLIEDRISEVDEIKSASDKKKARDIIINHVDDDYITEFTNEKDPIKILEIIKKKKREEVGVTVHEAYRNVINCKFLPHKESGKDFVKRFRNLVKEYESHPESSKLIDEFKKMLLFNAVEKEVPAVATAEILSKNANGVSLSYNQIELLISQIDPKIRSTEMKSNIVQREDKKTVICHKCGALGHVQRNCPNGNLKLCYRCNRFSDHIASDCKEDLKRKRSQDRHEDVKRVKWTSRNRSPTPYNKRSRRRSRSRSSEKQGARERTRSLEKSRSPIHKRSGNTNEGTTINYMSLKSDDDNYVLLEKFILDSGATEHITSSELIFNKSDKSNCKKDKIKCADKNANLSSEGKGQIKFILDNREVAKLDKVIYSENITRNILSLRKE